MNFVESDNLQYEYNKFDEENNTKISIKALKGIDISIKKGEFVSILGHNGSGKSTFARLINGLNTPTGGTLYVKSLDTSKENNIWEIRQNVGMAFQNPDNQLIATIVEDDVAFGPENLGMAPNTIRENVDKALRAVSMSEFKKATPAYLSGGQKQRVAIAGILAMKPECIILDEPTAMLDPIGRKEVMDTITMLNKEENITIILITHYMEEAALSDRVIVINDGLVAMEGTPREVFHDIKKMKQLHLDVPQITELSYYINKVRPSFPIDLLTIDEFMTAIKSIGFKDNIEFKNETNNKDKTNIKPIKPILEINNLSYTYAENTAYKQTALNNINLTINEGEFIGLIGHTGSGKSTLIQHLNALIKTKTGTILFKGNDIYSDNSKLKYIRQKIGLVFQYPEYQIFEETVYKEIAFGPINCGIDKNEIDIRVNEALKIVGLDKSYLDKSPFDLSGGQKRRVAIASILAMKPEVLIFDEPMAGLDPYGRDEILNNITKMHKELNITIILVSHSMEDISTIADKILVMNKGSIEMFDTTDNVFNNSKHLTNIGLNAPQLTLLFRQLKDEFDINIPTNIYKVKEAAEILISALQ